MILKTIPRSIRAGVALFLVFVCFYGGLKALQQILVPGEDSLWVQFQCYGGLIVGVGAVIAFYYFQSVDGNGGGYSELDTLTRYHQAEREKQKMQKTEITHAYDFDKETVSKPKDTNSHL